MRLQFTFHTEYFFGTYYYCENIRAHIYEQQHLIKFPTTQLVKWMVGWLVNRNFLFIFENIVIFFIVFPRFTFIYDSYYFHFQLVDVGYIFEKDRRFGQGILDSYKNIIPYLSMHFEVHVPHFEKNRNFVMKKMSNSQESLKNQTKNVSL